MNISESVGTMSTRIINIWKIAAVKYLSSYFYDEKERASDSSFNHNEKQFRRQP